MVKLVINKENTVNANAVKRISWNDLTQFFQRMFSVHEVAEHFSLGKTKSSYTMLDGVAPEFKKMLLYNVNQSPFLKFWTQSFSCVK